MPDLMSALKASLDAVKARDGNGASSSAKQGAGQEARRQEAGGEEVARQAKKAAARRVSPRGERVRARLPLPMATAVAPHRTVRRRACAARTRRAPGYTRRRCGKGFMYLDEDGERITDAEIVARIAGLVIPPAWKDVWISPDPVRPHPGDRASTQRGPQAVPLPPALARAPRPGEVRRHGPSSPRRCRRCARSSTTTSRSATCRASRCSPAPRACSSAASFASARRTTRSRTRPTAWRRCCKRHVTRRRRRRSASTTSPRSRKRRVHGGRRPRGRGRSSRRSSAAAAGGDELLAYKGRPPWRDVRSPDINAYLKAGHRPRHLGQGLPHLGRDRAGGGRRSPSPSRAPRPSTRASARSCAPSRRSRSTSATRRRWRAPPTSTRGSSTATATARRSRGALGLIAADANGTAIQGPVEAAVLDLLEA